MIKKLIYALMGYRQIDQVSGLWKHVYTAPNGKDVVLMSYAHYDVFYKRSTDKYKLRVSGFLPLKHFLNAGLMMIVEVLNTKEDGLDYTGTVQDYYLEKQVMMSSLASGFAETFSAQDSEGLTPGDLVIIKFDLKQEKDYILGFRREDKEKIQGIKNFKSAGVMSDDVEIYEEIDNILITSEGYYVCTHRDELNNLKDEEEN